MLDVGPQPAQARFRVVDGLIVVPHCETQIAPIGDGAGLVGVEAAQGNRRHPDLTEQKPHHAEVRPSLHHIRGELRLTWNRDSGHVHDDKVPALGLEILQ